MVAFSAISHQKSGTFLLIFRHRLENLRVGRSSKSLHSQDCHRDDVFFFWLGIGLSLCSWIFAFFVNTATRADFASLS